MQDNNEQNLNATETFLTKCLSDLLEVQHIGPQENLFELGYDSFVAAMVINDVKKEFNVDVPIFTIFDSPTITALALVIKNLQMES